MKKVLLGLITSFFLLPSIVLAYSNEVVLGGENIGIHIDTPGIMVIGFYRVNGHSIKGNPEIKIGDFITQINNQNVSTIDELTEAIEKNIKENEIDLTVLRNKENLSIHMTLEKVDDVYKTGLYVKDGITGLGTLSYIDPETKIYGALGHEIIESTSSKLVEVKTGNIFESKVTNIRRSSVGDAGEKNATMNYNHIYGSILNNTSHGIFGIYKESIPSSRITVSNEVHLGKAYIYTVLNGSKKNAYEINIKSIQRNNDVKNITFEVTDKTLISNAGGIVQGMSGSPIVQDDKLVGAVTHVVVDNPIIGYGIFITRMLESGDKINE